MYRIEVVTGGYSTDFGLMDLTQKDSGEVSGVYSFKGEADQEVHGRISGKMEGNVLYGSWSQSNGQSGTLQFTFSPGAFSFKGLWNYGSATPAYTWNGFFTWKPSRFY